MNVLTDDEKKALYDQSELQPYYWLDGKEFADMIEFAVLAKLAAQDVKNAAVVDEVATRMDGRIIFNGVGEVTPGQKLYTQAQLLATQVRTAEACAESHEIHRLQMALAERLAQAEQRIYDLTNTDTGELPTALAETERLQFALQRSEMECVCAKRQAAASQAREQQMALALERLDGWLRERYHVGLVPSERELLEQSQCQDTSALEAMIARAGEVMRERCVAECDESREVISALPGVTLEDLRK